MGSSDLRPKDLLLIVGLLLSFLVFSSMTRCDDPPVSLNPTEDVVAGATPSRASVTRVIDGDTFYLGDQRVRMAVIDAPEARTRAGDDATAWLIGKIEGKSVPYHFTGRDHYGRPLIVVWLPDETCFEWETSLNARMLSEKLATIYQRPEHHESGRLRGGR